MQANNSIICGYFCIGFIDFMFADITLIVYTSLFSSDHFEKNDNVISRNLRNDWMQFYWRN